jgi:phenylacetate-CoA ligase
LGGFTRFDKSNLQKPLLERLSKGYRHQILISIKHLVPVALLSFFARDKYCHALTWASIVSIWIGMELILTTSYQARFYGIPMDFIQETKRTLQGFFEPSVSIFDFRFIRCYFERC